MLEYSPGGPEPKFRTPAVATPEDVDLQMRYLVYGAMTATAAVLPAIRAVGTGTLLFTTGAGPVDPTPMLGDINTAGATLRNWAINLHKELGPEGIQAAHIAIGVWIGDRAPRAPRPPPRTRSHPSTGTCTPTATRPSRSSPSDRRRSQKPATPHPSTGTRPGFGTTRSLWGAPAGTNGSEPDSSRRCIRLLECLRPSHRA